MRFVKIAAQLGLRLAMIPFILFFYLCKRFLVVEFVLPNVTLFGHLALEPEKVLSKLKTEKQNSPQGVRRLLIWSLGKNRDQVNKALVKIWRRELWVLPSAIVDAMHRASKWFPNFEMQILQFDKLHENDHVLDGCETHLKFSKSELRTGEKYLREIGINPGDEYVCFVVREAAWAPPTTGPLSSGALRSRSFQDFLLAAQALAESGVHVIKLGAAGTTQVAGNKIIDYANSPEKSALLDVYLPAHSMCVVSTMSGPDAVALAARRPVLYIDIAQYSLCFAGTRLVTWVPALLNSQKLGRSLTLKEVFESGAGRFLGLQAFEEAGITIKQSSPEQIRDHCLAFYKQLASGSDHDEELQQQYRDLFHDLLSKNSVAKLGALNSRLSSVFVTEHASTFLN